MLRDARIIPVILCGGSGTRLWPASRGTRPKSLLSLISDRTMLQDAALRASGSLPSGETFAPPVVVCNQEHRFLAAEQLRAAGIRGARILAEPVGRNSAPAAAAAALLVAEDEPESLLWVMGANAVVTDVDALHEQLPAAVAAAQLGQVVAFGVPPGATDGDAMRIELGLPLGAAPRPCATVRPDAGPLPGEPADGSAAPRRPDCRPDMVMATAGTLLQAFRSHEPDLMRQVSRAVARREGEENWVRLDAESLDGCPDLSLGHAIAGWSGCVAVIPTAAEWATVGGWDALWRISPKDARGNVALGDVLLQESSGCYVRSDGALTAVVGLEDAVIVVTDDAVLAVHRERTEEVREVVRRLERYGRSEASSHSRRHHLWGSRECLVRQSRYQVERIVVHPGRKLSPRRHLHRSEHWTVVSGSALVCRGGEEVLVAESESIHVPLGCVHRLENPGLIPLVLIGVRLGSYLEENDTRCPEEDRAGIR